MDLGARNGSVETLKIWKEMENKNDEHTSQDPQTQQNRSL
jgi:hypothetical protein